MQRAENFLGIRKIIRQKKKNICLERRICLEIIIAFTCAGYDCAQYELEFSFEIVGYAWHSPNKSGPAIDYTKFALKCSAVPNWSRSLDCARLHENSNIWLNIINQSFPPFPFNKRCHRHLRIDFFRLLPNFNQTAII